MPIVFDEVVGTITPEPSPPEQPQRADGSEKEQYAGYLREEFDRIEHRAARLRAD
jgi:hypothetical protein